MHTPQLNRSRELPFEKLGGRIWDRELDPEPKIRTIPVTVCIAAMCTWEEKPVGDKPARLTPMIVGASDRMLTAGDIEFEPNQTKIADITDNIKALVAGDISVQTSFLYDAVNEVQKTSATEVKEIAQIYSNNFARYRREQAELKYLSPLGLDLQSFTESHLSSEIMDNIIYKLEHHWLGVETIITGVDATGAHIYTVKDPGVIACQDAVGFAAIGRGAGHSNSQFMFKGYTRQCPFAEAMFITYVAKRRAEVAPGVGKAETDMFIIYPDADHSRSYVGLDERTMEKLEKTYKNHSSQEEVIFDKSRIEIGKYVADIMDQSQEQPEQPEQLESTVTPIDGGKQ